MGNETTYDDQLNNVGKNMIKKFRGVFPRDKIPDLKLGESTILNTDTSKGKGEHWVAIKKMMNGEYLFYDSFGRKGKSLIPELKNKKIVDADISDREQQDKRFYKKDTRIDINCGQRCIAFLLVAQEQGDKYAMLI